MSSIGQRSYESTPSLRVSFLGLGVMGYPMAGHLAKAGLAVTPNSEDRIVDGDGAIYDLIRWDTDPVGAFWRFVMRVGRVAP